MATLEKIRSKSVLLFIIIIVALLAFILGDFLNSGRSYFGSGTTVYSAGSNKIDYNDYQNQVSQLNAQGQDADEQSQLMLQSMMLQNLINEQIDLMGISVTDSEITNIMNNYMPLTPQLQQAAQTLGIPASDRAMVLDAINNPSHYGLGKDHQDYLKSVWMTEEQQVEEAIKQQAIMNLVAGLFAANEVDAKAAYDNSMIQTPVQVVSVPVSGVSDNDIEVTDADLRAAYAQAKPAFDVAVFSDLNAPFNPSGRDIRPVAINEPTKAIDYVVVNIVPSQADYAEASAQVASATSALRSQNGVEGLNGLDKFSTESSKLTRSEIKNHATLRALADSDLQVNNVKQLAFNRGNNTHNIVKVLGTEVLVDSVQSSMYLMPIAHTDSVMALIEGSSIEDLIAENPNNGFSKRWARLENPQYQANFPFNSADLRAALASATPGKVALYTDSLNGLAIAYEVTERRAPQQFYDLVIASYTVDPSAQTISDLKMNLNSFLASNSNGEMFSAKADSLYHLQHGIVNASSAHIGNVAGTRQAVKWAMDNKPGKVSRVFDTPAAYVVVAVKENIEDYVPYNSPLVTNVLTAQARKNKKAEKLMEQYAGKAQDLAGYASLMNSEVRTDSMVVFNAQRVANHFGDNHAILGQIAAAKPGTVVGPIQNDNEVVVFVAAEPTDANSRPYDFTNDGSVFMRDFGINFNSRRPINPAIFNLFVGDRKVKNNSLNFVQAAE